MSVGQCWVRWLLLVALVGSLSCGKHEGDRVGRYKEVSRQVKEDPATAIIPLGKLAQEEANNALPHYLSAAANARMGKWEQTLREVEAGNTITSCTYPIAEATPYRNFLGLTALRQLLQDADSTPGLDLDTQKRLLLALRGMGERIATGEPRCLTTAQVGAWIRHKASQSVVKLQEQGGHLAEAGQARNVTAADETWLQTVKQTSDATFKEGGVLDAKRLLQKYRFTPDEAHAYDTGQTPSTSAQEKMRQLSEEMDQTERTLTDGLLKNMPR